MTKVKRTNGQTTIPC